MARQLAMTKRKQIKTSRHWEGSALPVIQLTYTSPGIAKRLARVPR